MVSVAVRAPGVKLDHAAEPPAEFSGNVGGHHVDRLELVDLEARSETQRAVVVQRDAVDDVLRVVFRPARMQHGVGLEQPSRHGVDSVDRAATQCAERVQVELVPAEPENGAGLIRIEQRG